MRTRALLVVAVTVAAGLAFREPPGRLNPVIELLSQKRPVFGLYAPANPRPRPAPGVATATGAANPAQQSASAAAPATPAPKSQAQLAQDALAYPNADYIFDGSMERNFDRGYATFVEFAQGMFDGGVLSKPAARLRQPLFVKTPEIATDAAKAREHISQQLNLGVSGIVFVDVKSAAEV